MKILHSSDLHGRYKWLLKEKNDFDVWVDTGDFLPNYGRGPKTGYAIQSAFEAHFQRRWLGLTRLAPRISEWLDGRPCVLVYGNHDFMDYGTFLKQAGSAAHIVTPQGFELHGLRWAGFREISWIDGEWAGEIHDPRPLIEETFKADPDILVTHSPPGGILDYDPYAGRGWGFSGLTSSLVYQEHRVKHHLFGHVHAQGGKSKQHGGIFFHNSAECVRLIEVT